MSRTEYTATFLIDKDPPENITFLKRAADKSFAPNFFTGIGGGIGDVPGYENESPKEGAYRELSEETGGQLNSETIDIIEIGRCIYDTGNIIYYFCGIPKDNISVQIDPKEGTLVQVSTSDLTGVEFIPSVSAIYEEWSKRGFNTQNPFTVYVKELGKERTVRLIEILRVEDGLKHPK